MSSSVITTPNTHTLLVVSIVLLCILIGLVVGVAVWQASLQNKWYARKVQERNEKERERERENYSASFPTVEGRGRAGPHTSQLDPAYAPSLSGNVSGTESSQSKWRWLRNWTGGRGRGASSSYAVGGEEVYADNNATTQVFPEVVDTIVQAYTLYYANSSSIHAAGKRSAEALEHNRDIIAGLIGARPEEIYYTSGATESNNLAIRGVMRVALSPSYCALIHGNTDAIDDPQDAEEEERLKYATRSERERILKEREARKTKLASKQDKRHRKACRRKIVTTPIEHASVYETVATIDPSVEVVHVKVDRTGKVDATHFAALVRDPEVAMACIIMANNEIGTIQDVSRLAKLCRQNDVHFHCDMTQVFGKYDVDMETIGADSATMSAHKFHGPKGVGALYVRQGTWIDNSCMTGGTQEGALRAGTENVAGVCGMTVALQRCSELRALGRDREVRHMRDTVQRTLTANIPGLVVNGDAGSGLYNTLSVCIPDVNSRQLIPVLDQFKVYVNTGCACSKGQGSATLKALGLSEKYVNGSLRISLSFFTTEEQCRILCTTLLHALHVLRDSTAEERLR